MSHLRKLDRSAISGTQVLDGVFPLYKDHEKTASHFYLSFKRSSQSNSRLQWWIQECTDSLEKNTCTKKAYGELDEFKYTLLDIGYVN